jgi:HEAT repeat protein
MEDLAVALTDADPAKRWAAARSAGERVDSVPILANALSEEAETHVREAIFTALVRVGSMESIFVILPYLRSDDAGLRTGALDALRAAPSAAQGHLRDLLSDPDPDVRILACDLARVVNDLEALRLLGELLRSEPEANVCGAVVEVLAEIGNPGVAEALSLCAARFPNDPFLSFAVQATLKRLGGHGT